MMGSLRALLLVSAVPALIAGPALAQPKPGPAPTPAPATPTPSPPTPAQQKQANDFAKQAIDKNGQGKYLEAIELYQKAFEIIPLPLLLSNIGTNFQQAGKKPEALKYFCMFLEKEKDTSGVNYQYGKAQAKSLQIELGNPVSDDNVCAPPAPPPPPPPPRRNGSTEMTPPLDRGAPGKGLRMTGLGVAGLGVVGLGVGLFFGVKAKGISDDISDHPADKPWDTDIKQMERDGQRYEDLQVRLMIAGGLVAVAGGVIYFVGRAKGNTSSEQLSVRPSASPDGVGVVLGGSF